jgi:hypothetical protein
MNLEQPFPLAHPRKNFAPRPRALRAVRPAQIQPFMHFARRNPCRINSSENFAVSPISFALIDLKSSGINTSGNKDLKSPRINSSGHKDLKSFRINTSKKQGRGVGLVTSARRIDRANETHRNLAGSPCCVEPTPNATIYCGGKSSDATTPARHNANDARIRTWRL